MPKDFYKLCPVEFHHALKDWQELEDEKHKDNWERTRLLSFFVFNSSFNIKRTLKKPRDLFSLDWDKEIKPIIFSKKYVKRLRKRDKKVFEILEKQKQNGRKNHKRTNN